MPMLPTTTEAIKLPTSFTKACCRHQLLELRVRLVRALAYLSSARPPGASEVDIQLVTS